MFIYHFAELLESLRLHRFVDAGSDGYGDVEASVQLGQDIYFQKLCVDTQGGIGLEEDAGRTNLQPTLQVVRNILELEDEISCVDPGVLLKQLNDSLDFHLADPLTI